MNPYCSLPFSKEPTTEFTFILIHHHTLFHLRGCFISSSSVTPRSSEAFLYVRLTNQNFIIISNLSTFIAICQKNPSPRHFNEFLIFPVVFSKRTYKLLPIPEVGARPFFSFQNLYCNTNIFFQSSWIRNAILDKFLKKYSLLF